MGYFCWWMDSTFQWWIHLNSSIEDDEFISRLHVWRSQSNFSRPRWRLLETKPPKRGILKRQTVLKPIFLHQKNFIFILFINKIIVFILYKRWYVCIFNISFIGWKSVTVRGWQLNWKVECRPCPCTFFHSIWQDPKRQVLQKWS